MTVGHLMIAFNAEFGTNKRETAIGSDLRNHKIRCGRRRRYTREQAAFIANSYAGRSIADMTAVFNSQFGKKETKRQIISFVKNRGIVSGRSGRFEKGHRPHNYGKKGWASGGRSVKTRFKPGRRPHTWLPVGSERVTKAGLLQKKVSDTGYGSRDWQSVHSWLWVQNYGPIPEGHIVVFRDGDRKNNKIENLEMISRGENMRRNSIHNLPEELVDVCRIRGVLNRHINKRMGKNEK